MVFEGVRELAPLVRARRWGPQLNSMTARREVESEMLAPASAPWWHPAPSVDEHRGLAVGLEHELSAELSRDLDLQRGSGAGEAVLLSRKAEEADGPALPRRA